MKFLDVGSQDTWWVVLLGCAIGFLAGLVNYETALLFITGISSFFVISKWRPCLIQQNMCSVDHGMEDDEDDDDDEEEGDLDPFEGVDESLPFAPSELEG